MNKPARTKILLVDDEEDILDLVGYNLVNEGYEVHTAANGKEAIQIADEIIPDLILLDVMMPEMDGMETCTIIRENEKLKTCLVAFLSARGEDYSQIAGYDVGADDYITKPIKPRVLMSKVKGLLRRKELMDTQHAPNEGVIIDKERYVVIKDGEELNLPKKEFELLSLLASRPEHVFTRDHILSAVWGEDVVVGGRTIDVHIRKLREKIGDKRIQTIKGVGYKFRNQNNES
ncbi:MAG: response regulator transcription factor [Flavobacteriales bacterium]|nr:response regulator transcription factor [Flavobacteriales bacterium]